MDSIDEYVARYQGTFTDDKLRGVRKWLHMGTGREDPFVVMWREYLEAPFCR